MNQKVLNTLEYDKVIERLKAYATTELGKAACEKLFHFLEYMIWGLL